MSALLVLAITAPLLGLVPLLLLGPRTGERAALGMLAVNVAITAGIAERVAQGGRALGYFVGGFAPPLGVGLRADGFAAAMMLMAALVLLFTGLFAMTGPGDMTRKVNARGSAGMPATFFILLLSLACALNLAFLAQDLFTLYVALELLTFAAVPLVCLEGKAGQLAAALTYLLFALFGSVLYLLGVVLIYGLFGTLDIAHLAGLMAHGAGGATAAAALALMSAGLMAKAALFPLHLWLPPAHSGAPPAASAVLSAVVIKAPLFLLVRLWSDLAPLPLTQLAGPVFALCGAAAIVFCGVVALAQERLKLLIAYSTAAQIGYLCLMFPLAASSDGPSSALAWTGGTLHLVSHALSKAAMFLAAGLIAETMGHDRLSGLGGVGRLAPVSVAAFGLGGLSLMGLPPSGGFVAKVMLLTSALQQGSWWIATVVLVGGLLAGGYVLRVVVIALQYPDADLPEARECRWRALIALALAFGAMLVGFMPLAPLPFLEIGRPLTWTGVMP
ncbi:NADH dehydrogenase (quinone) [Xanthobacter versatilis]|uniref:NADH dehydrogenase (Quinone) n=1 Tax=Xanthobacter autotrophicus (strain ATCC BAA-1158 / Py2) TaxID=78245 RepID=A7IFN6_XANP2|nr:NADH dehydrogenase (quinone) [Xanthobacter autotrophicus Py2]